MAPVTISSTSLSGGTPVTRRRRPWTAITSYRLRRPGAEYYQVVDVFHADDVQLGGESQVFNDNEKRGDDNKKLIMKLKQPKLIS
jgi:hypothetical protein